MDDTNHGVLTMFHIGSCSAYEYRLNSIYRVDFLSLLALNASKIFGGGTYLLTLSGYLAVPHGGRRGYATGTLQFLSRRREGDSLYSYVDDGTA